MFLRPAMAGALPVAGGLLSQWRTRPAIPSGGDIFMKKNGRRSAFWWGNIGRRGAADRWPAPGTRFPFLDPGDDPIAQHFAVPADQQQGRAAPGQRPHGVKLGVSAREMWQDFPRRGDIAGPAIRVAVAQACGDAILTCSSADRHGGNSVAIQAVTTDCLAGP